MCAPSDVFVSNEDLRPDGMSRSKLEAERKKHAEFVRQRQMQEEREKLKKKEEDARIVREKYAREKADKARKRTGGGDEPAGAVVGAAAAAAVAASPKHAATASSSSKGPVTIQVRVPNRNAIVISDLVADSTLAELYDRVDALAGPAAKACVLTIPFPPPPQHLFRSDASRMSQTLAQLGLTPRAALVLTEESSLGKVAQGHGEAPAHANAFPFPHPHPHPHPPGPGGIVGGGGFGGVALGGNAGAPAAGAAVDLTRTVESRYLQRAGVHEDCVICQGELADGDRIRSLPCMHGTMRALSLVLSI